MAPLYTMLPSLRQLRFGSNPADEPTRPRSKNCPRLLYFKNVGKENYFK